MTDYNILFLDIDGTILTPDDTIQDSTKEAIKQVQQKGLYVFLATGRPLHEIAHIGRELNIQSFIGYNGAYAVHNGQDVLIEPMNARTIEHLLEVAKQNGHEMILYTNEKNMVTSLDNPIVTDFLHRLHLSKNESFRTEFIDDILGVTLLNLQENDVSLYEKDETIHLSQVNLEGLRHSYDVIRDNVNKGFAVNVILELLNIPRKKAIAFGDGMNDKEMLKLVGAGFAMGNAHPGLFEYAKNKTTDVTDSGIFNGLKSLGLIN